MSLMVDDLEARALAEDDSGFRVSARIVKESLESEAMMVSMSFEPCLPVAPRTRRGLRAVMAGYVARDVCIVQVIDGSY